MDILAKEVTRVELIDDKGRQYVKYGKQKVEFDLQDDGKTLKIFVNSDFNEVDDEQKLHDKSNFVTEESVRKSMKAVQEILNKGKGQWRQ